MTGEGESAVCRSIRFMIVAAAVERYGTERLIVRWRFFQNAATGVEP